MIRFVARTSLGEVFVEADGVTWDDVPVDAVIEELRIEPDGDKFAGSLPTLRGHAEFFFANEAVAMAGGQGLLVAKIVGGVRPTGEVDEFRVEIGDGGKLNVVTVDRPDGSELPYTEASFRRGG